MINTKRTSNSNNNATTTNCWRLTVNNNEFIDNLVESCGQSGCSHAATVSAIFVVATACYVAHICAILYAFLAAQSPLLLNFTVCLRTCARCIQTPRHAGKVCARRCAYTPKGAVKLFEIFGFSLLLLALGARVCCCMCACRLLLIACTPAFAQRDYTLMTICLHIYICIL